MRLCGTRTFLDTDEAKKMIAEYRNKLYQECLEGFDMFNQKNNLVRDEVSH